MCGIVGAIRQRNVGELLIVGLQHLEYRGYDSAGLAVIGAQSGDIEVLRCVGKVAQLAGLFAENTKIDGLVGLAHTRWATHGRPMQHNAHPHCSQEAVAIVHNGIIENYSALRQSLKATGYSFESETDSEVIAHLLHWHWQQQQDPLRAVQKTVQQLEGAYALGILFKAYPDRLIAVRQGNPLTIGVGISENYLASDAHALLSVTQRFIYLEDGDIAVLSCENVDIYNQDLQHIKRPIQNTSLTLEAVTRGPYRHFMLKEIFAQPEIIARQLQQYFLTLDGKEDQTVWQQLAQQIHAIAHVHIVACGTSYHAGLVARYWLEAIAGVTCSVEMASEFRYRSVVVPTHCLFIALSQSGETADTLAALRAAKKWGYQQILSICNVAHSTMARESDQVLLTYAGTEIGVAATKTFSAQLMTLLCMTLTLAKTKQRNLELVATLEQQMQELPTLIQQALALDVALAAQAHFLSESNSALFIGRHISYPIAMEAALKLKEISYVHAEAYAAGELKHGPLALIDEHMPVLVIAPMGHYFSKIQGNVQEIQARNAPILLLTDAEMLFPHSEGLRRINVPSVHELLSPLVYMIPLQLLAYHVAVLKGTDVDQPRNLAKSVTVE